MTPQNLELLKKYRISIPPEVSYVEYEAGELFDFLPKNSGLTEEFIYNNENPLSLQLPVYTASFEPIGFLPMDSYKDGRPLKVCNGEVIIIFRQGYAGLMYIPEEPMFFASEHTIPIKVKAELEKELNQQWFAKYYQPEVMRYVTGKADSGNFSQLAFEKMSFIIPERSWQDECAKHYLDLAQELDKTSKNISSLNVSENRGQKGLSDSELVAKYGDGGMSKFKGAVKTMIKTESTTAPRKTKKK